MRSIALLLVAAAASAPTIVRAQSDTVTLIRGVSARSPLAALAGKSAGVHVTTISGQPGSEPVVELRALSSVLVTPDPLIVVDGAITRLVLGDLNVDDVERIEVLKGPSASALYGADGGNGVVRVFTRRSDATSAGKPAFAVRNEYGRNIMPRVLELSGRHSWQMNAAGTDFLRDALGSRVAEPDQIADNRYPANYAIQRELFRPRDYFTNYLSVAQRFSRAGVFASFHNQHDAGALAIARGLSRQSGRINVDYSPLEPVDVAAGAFVGQSAADDPSAGVEYAVRSIEPHTRMDSTVTSSCPTGVTSCYVALLDRRPMSAMINPLYLLQELDTRNDRDRRMAHVDVAYRPLDWLTIKGNLASDKAYVDHRSTTPQGFISASQTSQGSLALERDTDRVNVKGVSLSITRALAGGRLRNVSTVAYAEDRHTSIQRQQFFSTLAPPPPSAPSFGSFRQRISASRGTLFSSSFDVDHFTLEGLVRRDHSSFFSAGTKLPLYHRIAGSYRLGDAPRIRGVSDLSVRISHGTAGIKPTTLMEQILLGPPGAVPQAGPAPLHAAFSAETEYRFDARVLGRYLVQYDFVRRRTSDQIMQRPVPQPSSISFAWVNAGSVTGTIHELTLGAEYPIGAAGSFQLHIVGDRSRARLTNFKIAAFTNGTIFVRNNEPLGQLAGYRLVRTQAQLEETIRAGALTGTANNYVRNEEGFYVRAAQYHTINEVPLVAWSCADSATPCASRTATVPIGNLNPDFTAGFVPSLRWKSMNAAATLSWVKGGNIYNWSRATSWLELRDRAFDQSAKLDAGACPALTVDANCPYVTGKKPRGYYQSFYPSSSQSEYFVEPASYLKLSELAIDWRLPAKWIAHLPSGSGARLGVAGRNLWTRSRFSGYDPDVAFRDFNSAVFRGIDYFQYPAYRTITASLTLGS
jgi:TonB-dependent SusC/RagA subfamily outer membrane receptor